MDLVVVASAALLATAMLASATRKATRAPASRVLREQLRITPTTWGLIGAAEAAAVCGLGLGFAVPAIGAAAAAGVALLMTGAVIAHVRVGLAGRPVVPPAVLAVLAVLTAAGFAGS